MESIFIFGHRNPDTDSVCSCISLSYLKNKLGQNTVPRVLGHINKESKFVLDYFGVKEPEYLNDVKVQLRNIEYNKNMFVNENTSIINAINFMQKKEATAIPVVNQKKQLIGFVSLKEIATMVMNGIAKTLNTSYENILQSLDGEEILKFDEEIKGNVLIGSYQSQTFFDEVQLATDDILIVGDRYKVINYAIESHVKLIIITGGHHLIDELYEKAKKNKVNIIATPKDTFSTGNKIFYSNYIKNIITNTNPITCNYLDYRTEFIDLANKIGHTNYPIVNKKKECLGLIKVTDVDKHSKQKVILVDHNSLEQSVPGIEEAEIAEIIDHHNLGAIGTSIPINFRSMPVGCTATILYKMYQEYNVEIPKNIAGLMLSAILSDTMLFKSPTCTEEDKKAAENLSNIAGVNIDTYGLEMLTAGSSIQGMSIEDIIYQDFKSYKVGNNTLGISQVFTMDFENIKKDIEKYIEKLDEIAKGEYAVVTLFVTDVLKNGSYILFNTEAKDIISDSFDVSMEEGYFIQDLVSRKKQMLPNIMETLEKRA